MIAPWLLYASALGALIATIALLLERIARWRNTPGRWIWLAAIVAMVAVPIALSLRTPVAPERPAFSREGQFAGVAPAAPQRDPIDLDTPLLIVWALASVLLASRVIGGAVALRRRRKSWVSADLGGKQVLLSDELGPAVIGWHKLTTVIPRWAFSFDERSRSLMLEHEAEHASSGDPYLRGAALLALVAMPWNPAIWWATRRLRLAVEIDCDRRVLARGADPRLYASLLLAVGERMSATPFAWATALGGSRSSLETRIVAMTSQISPRRLRLAIAGVSAVVVALIAVACASPVPDPVVPPAETATAKAPLVKVTADPYDVVADTIEWSCRIGDGCTDSTAHRSVVWRRRAPGDTTVREYEGYRIYRAAPDRDTTGAPCGAGADCSGWEVRERVNDTIVRYYRGKAEPFLRDGEVELAISPSGVEYVVERPSFVQQVLEVPSLRNDSRYVRKVLTPPVEGHRLATRDDSVSICTAAQAAAKRNGPTKGGFWPRCID